MTRSADRRLQVESLERREMMAGNVTLTAQGNNLYLTGDGSRNAVDIRAVSPGVFTVKGETLGGAFTKINGVANGQATIRGDLNNLYINLGGGADSLNVGTGNGVALNVKYDLGIDAGSGSDWVAVRDVNVGRDIAINTGTGVHDHTYLSNVNVGDDLFVYDPTSVYSGDWDELAVNNVKVRDQMQIEFRGGNDRVDIVSSAAEGIYASLGAGNDTFVMNYTKPRSKFAIYGGSGYDTFFVPSYSGTRFFGSGFEKVTNG